MKDRVRFAALAGFVFWLAFPLTGADLNNAVWESGGYVLAAGPKVEGVALCYQVREGQNGWPEPTLKAFRETPWLDAASIRMRWKDLEPEDQKFNWIPMDSLLAEVKNYNASHSENPRGLHIRVMAGVHSPTWFEAAGVRFYDTTRINPGQTQPVPLHVPMPYENPEFLKQLREVYRAMVERFKDEPLVVMYHGTWSAGPWDEIFLPKDGPMPPGYTPQKFIDGMIEQLDVLLEEISLKRKPGELPYSGDIPKDVDHVRDELNKRVVERLGRRSPYFYAQSNGWGGIKEWIARPIAGKEVWDVNWGYQAVGVNNANWGVLKQGDWIPLVEVAQENQIPYVEIYPEDLITLDVEHHIVEAFTQTREEAASGRPGTIPGFIGYRPWLRERNFPMYVRDGTVREEYHCGEQPRKIARLATRHDTPEGTSVAYRARTRLANGVWSDWREAANVGDLPAGNEAQIEAALHTDDGFLTPRVIGMAPVADSPSGSGAWVPLPGSSQAGP